MKNLNIARDIVPIGELKPQASAVITSVREEDRQVVVTQNGRPAAVILSPATYDSLMESRRFAEALRQGLADSEAGRMVEDEALDEILDRELGPREST